MSILGKAVAFSVATVITFIIAALILLNTAVAGEVEPPKAIEDCSWKPTQATGVYYKCDDVVNGVTKKLVGDGVVTIVICGKPYYLEIDCKPKVAP
jgi:hypothetical protein